MHVIEATLILARVGYQHLSFLFISGRTRVYVFSCFYLGRLKAGTTMRYKTQSLGLFLPIGITDKSL